MKITKQLNEAAQTPLEKMQDANTGKRRQNWGACSDTKLKTYYQICLSNGLHTAQYQCEMEIKKRGYNTWLVPRVGALDNFPVMFAQEIWNERKTCHRLIQNAIDLTTVSANVDVLRPSEYLTRIYMLIKCMGHETELKMLEIWIKNHMKDQQTYYDLIPTIISKAISLPGVPDKIARAVAQVNYN